MGVFSVLAIGLGFMWVIRFEYYFGAYRWKWVASVGIALCALSLVMPNFMLTALLGIIGGSIIWGSVELPHQEERVDNGLFKAHPLRNTRPRLNNDNHNHSHAHSHGDKPGLGKWWSF